MGDVLRDEIVRRTDAALADRERWSKALIEKYKAGGLSEDQAGELSAFYRDSIRRGLDSPPDVYRFMLVAEKEMELTKALALKFGIHIPE